VDRKEGSQEVKKHSQLCCSLAASSKHLKIRGVTAGFPGCDTKVLLLGCFRFLLPLVLLGTPLGTRVMLLLLLLLMMMMMGQCCLAHAHTCLTLNTGEYQQLSADTLTTLRSHGRYHRP
jgi:hypothetical protein